MNNKPVKHFIDHHKIVSEALNPDAVKDARELAQAEAQFRIEEHSHINSYSYKNFHSFHQTPSQILQLLHLGPVPV